MIHDTYKGIGAQIRTYRKAHHLTQKGLAARIGKSVSFLGHIERGTRKMSMGTFLDIVVALRLDANSLLRTVIPDDLADIWEADHYKRCARILDSGVETAEKIEETMDALTHAAFCLAFLLSPKEEEAPQPIRKPIISNPIGNRCL